MMDRRWAHFTAMVLIGDGIMAMLRPSRDATAWAMGPRPWRKTMRVLSRHPTLTRVVGAAEVMAGIWWATREEKLLE